MNQNLVIGITLAAVLIFSASGFALVQPEPVVTTTAALSTPSPEVSEPQPVSVCEQGISCEGNCVNQDCSAKDSSACDCGDSCDPSCGGTCGNPTCGAKKSRSCNCGR